MKVYTLINEYRSPGGGEQRVVYDADRALRRRGVETRVLARSSDELVASFSARLRAAWAGAYDPRARREFGRLLDSDRPDVVHAHNLYPLFSPSVLEACRERGIPTVFSLHNFGFTCPVLTHYRSGEVCHLCRGGSVWPCVRHNCGRDLGKSVAYAFRAAVARRRRLFVDNVTLLVVLNRFAIDWVVDAGFDRERIVVLPNMVELPTIACEPEHGGTVLFVGRIYEQKGLRPLVEAARALPHVPFEIAGSGPLEDELRATAPANVRWLGWLDSTSELAAAYSRARCVVMPSLTFEGCPLVILEAAARGLPVVTSRRGGMSELVEDGVNGLLAEPNDAVDLAAAVRRLMEDPDLAKRLGSEARERVRRNHSEEGYVDALLAIYERAIRSSESGPAQRASR